MNKERKFKQEATASSLRLLALNNILSVFIMGVHFTPIRWKIVI
jgi:hypothetical protein